MNKVRMSNGYPLVVAYLGTVLRVWAKPHPGKRTGPITNMGSGYGMGDTRYLPGMC